MCPLLQTETSTTLWFLSRSVKKKEGKIAYICNISHAHGVHWWTYAHGKSGPSNTESAAEIQCYKELMAQCNLLGRSESRTRQKLEKAKELIKKLKARVQDLEKELEEKENDIIRT